MNEQVPFASPDLLVRGVTGGGSDMCFVTFDSYTDRRTLDRQGFGEAFFRTRGIDAVHIISRDNRWYQHPELPDALAAARIAIANAHGPVIAYGSSMGGFAALRYGSACGATVGIALSPQYSVDPAVTPFEDRWADDVAQIHFRVEEIAPLPLQYVVYDPLDRHDRRHAALFAARSPTVEIRISNAGHPVGGYLNESETFEPLFQGVRTGALTAATAPAFERDLRQRRRMSGQYFFTLAQRVPAYRPRQKLALARLAADANPVDPPYRSYLGLMLDEAGAFDAAKESHLRAIELSQGTIHTVHHLALHHEKRGDLAEAHRLLDELIAAHPAVKILRESRLRVRRRMRHATMPGRLARLLRLDSLLDRID